MTHPAPTPFLAQSDHIVLRRLRPEDCAEFQAYRRDPDVARFQSWEPMTDEQARDLLHHMQTVAPLLRPGKWAQIGVATPDSAGIIGDMGLFLDDMGEAAEIGITLARSHHGQGHATKAMRLAINLILDTTQVARIICGADQRNAPSLAMIARLPFRFTHFDSTPEGTDEMFELTRQMWQEHRRG